MIINRPLGKGFKYSIVTPMTATLLVPVGTKQYVLSTPAVEPSHKGLDRNVRRVTASSCIQKPRGRREAGLAAGGTGALCIDGVSAAQHPLLTWGGPVPTDPF